MPSAADLLRGQRYELSAGQFGEEMPPPPPPDNLPSRQQAPPMESGPSYASLLAETRAEAPAPPAAAIAPQSAPPDQPFQRPRPGMPDWMTPERKAMYESSKKAAQNYRNLVEARRSKRKMGREYDKMYHQLQQAMGAADDLDALQKTYPHMFPPDDPRTMAMKRQQLQHFEKVQRLNAQIREMLQKHGVKIDGKKPLPESPFGGTDEDDRMFDQQMFEGFADAMTTPYQ